MNCDEVRGLTGAYALGSVSPEEKRQIEDHLVICNLHPEISGLLATVRGLASAAAEMEPPTTLGGRISAAIRAEPAPATTATPPEPRVRTRVARFTSWPVAAVLAVAIGALIVWNVSMQLSDHPENLVHFMKEADGDWVRIEAKLGQPSTTFALGGFETLPSDRSYQLWAMRDHDAINLGVFNTDDEGKWSGDMDVPLQRGDMIALTEEAAGGSSAPTMDPLISTRL